MGSIPVQYTSHLRSRLRDLYESAAVTFTVKAPKQFLRGWQAQDGRQGVGTTLYRPSTLSWQLVAKRSTGSEQLAFMVCRMGTCNLGSCGWHEDGPMQGIAV